MWGRAGNRKEINGDERITIERWGKYDQNILYACITCLNRIYFIQLIKGTKA